MGLLYISAILKKAGHEPKIHDCAIDYTDLQILRHTIKNWRPDFIGISIIITELEQTVKIMKIIRNIIPDVPITFGGPWPSANPEKSLKKYGANFVVIGEGELVFTELIEAINRGQPTDSIPGTASEVNGRIKINEGKLLTDEELNSLPSPAWELLDHNLYAKRHSMAGVGFRPYMTLVTSRGCPYKCVYCHQTMGKSFRKRSAASVIAEMEELRFKYGFKEFEIADDCFNLDRPRMQKILAEIPKRLSAIKLHFPSGVRSDMLEPEDMHLFKRAGTVSACFAIETASSRLQKLIRKNLSLEKATKVINAAVKAGIYSTGYFMMGLPTETYEEACETVNFAVHSPLQRAVFFYTVPFAGTKLSEMVIDNIKDKKETIDSKDMLYFSSSVNISEMSDAELHTVIRRAYQRFYLNPRRMFQILISHPNLLNLPRDILMVLIKAMRRRRDKAENIT